MSYKIDFTQKDIKKAYDLAFGRENNFDERIYILGLKGEEEGTCLKKTPLIQDLKKEIHDITFKKNANYYIGANTFVSKSPKHNNDSVFGLRNIVVDIDFHGIPDFEAKVLELEKILNEYWTSKEYPIWNILCRTGRGIQLWWCFSQCSRKLRFLYDNVKKAIIEEINNAMSEYPITLDNEQVDQSASMRLSGLYRLFGTYHSKVKKFTNVKIMHGQKYDLNILKTYFITDKPVAKPLHSKLKHKTKKPFTQNSNIHAQRMYLIRDLILSRDLPIGAELRNLNIFHFYNEAIQFYAKRETAVEKTFEINKLFKNPLKDSTLYTTFRCVDKKTNNKNNKNCYIYTNKKIIENLGISDSEQENFKFYPAEETNINRNLTRDLRRKIKRDKRNEEILTLNEMGLNYSQIGRAVGCCARTVKKVIQNSTTA